MANSTGSANAQSPANRPLFSGAPSGRTAPAASGQGQTSNLFSGFGCATTSTPAGSTQGRTGGLFGATTSTSATPAQGHAGSLFGGDGAAVRASATPAHVQTNSLFSQPPPQSSHVSSGSLFGASSRPRVTATQEPQRYSADVQRQLDFVGSLKGLLSSPHDFSDFKIIAGETEYQVHRVVLAAHSGFFKRLFQSKFKEADEREVTLYDDAPSAVEAMIQYFYRFAYDAPTTGRLLHHSTVFTLADKYEIAGLKELACEAFAHAIYSIFWTGDSLPKDLMAAAPHVYTHTPGTDDRLRKKVVEAFVKNDKEVLKGSEKGAFDKMLQEVPELACDLIPALTGIKMREGAECT